MCALADQVPAEFLVLRASASRAERFDDHGVLSQLFTHPELAPDVVAAVEELTGLRAGLPDSSAQDARYKRAL
ncbi:MAG: hypothetical protein L0H59_12365 [Tomitella sp.]|nr:hypothetical protein [Tomitella sp.]